MQEGLNLAMAKIKRWILDVWRLIKNRCKPLLNNIAIAVKLMNADKKKQKYLIRRYSLR